ncbi:MAG: LLM class flavin-dependent oxidoreductase [Chromatiales bacterium]|nr:LLM class flavin-dependent oxidoreductase [Chromatiales bacterium]
MSEVTVGFLLPTRERVMEGRHETGSLLALAEQAEALGLDAVWVGDSIVARPRHEPLTLLAAVAARTRRVSLGTAVLLPALRNPVVLAHQVATLDRIAEGRVILGVGIATDAPSIRAEFTAVGVPFEGRVGRMLEGIRLSRALWRGEPVTWDGRWTLKEHAVGPTPHRPGGPPIWIGSRVRAGIERAGRHFDGWFPTGPDAATYRDQITQVREVAAAAGRDPDSITAAVYLTVLVDDDRERAARRIDAYLESYYGAGAAAIRRSQGCFGGPAGAVGEWLQGFVEAGARHVVVRLVGDHARQLETLAEIRPR